MTANELKSKLASLKPNESAVIYLGAAGFLISHKGQNALVDPYLSYSVDRAIGKDDWRRRYTPPFSPEELGFVDAVFMSHDHLDHADPDTIAPLAAANVSICFVCSRAIADNVRTYGAENVVGLASEETVVFGDMKVTAIPAAHEQIHFDENGDVLECGFIFDLDGVRVYHSGDSLVYDGLEDRVRGVDVMLLPVNGNGFYRRAADIVGNMDSYDAANLASRCACRLLVPMHHDLYDGNSVPAPAVAAIIGATAPTLRFELPTPGEGWKVTSGEISKF